MRRLGMAPVLTTLLALGLRCAPTAAWLSSAAHMQSRAATPLCSGLDGELESGGLLQSALEGLSEGERYNVVLQGLLRGRKDTKTLNDRVWPLVQEMTSKNKKLDSKTRTELIDATVAATDPSQVETAMQALRKNGGLTLYAADMKRVAPPNANDARKRDKLLAELPVVPTDDRQSEILAALSFLAITGGSGVWEGLAPVLHQDAGLANIVLGVVALAVVVDNVGWVVASLASSSAKTSGQDSTGPADRIQAAARSTKQAVDSAASAGQGTRLVLAGVNRLFTRDLTRECRCEAASFLVAYLIGLPSFTQRPGVLEASKLAEQNPDSFGTVAGVNRLLVWLMAGVAAESAQHRQLIVSDPRQAAALLRLLRSRGAPSEESAGNLAEDDELRLRAALEQAELLLRRNGALADALRMRLEGGAATVGSCVALIESK